MGRRTNVLENSLGRDIEKAEEDGKFQIHAGGKTLAIYSLPGLVRYQRIILLIPFVFI